MNSCKPVFVKLAAAVAGSLLEGQVIDGLPHVPPATEAINETCLESSKHYKMVLGRILEKKITQNYLGDQAKIIPQDFDQICQDIKKTCDGFIKKTRT